MGMGDIAIEQYERGWRNSDKYVCSKCIEDAYLKQVVADSSETGNLCTFCGAEPSADFDTFLESFMVGVDNQFEQADNAGMPWDEGEYVFTTYNTWEIVDEFSWVAAESHQGEVLEEIVNSLEDKVYASRWWLELEPDRAYSSTWQEFCAQIKHKTRFVFWATAGDDAHIGAGEIPMARVIEHIGKLLQEFELVTTLPAGTITYRARGHNAREESVCWAARDLGTNVPERSMKSNRMSPAGISLFYGASDAETALTESARADSSDFFTIAQFKTTMETTVVDLTDIPEVPSIFHPTLGRRQGELKFLNALVAQLREPVAAADSVLDYIPTQVFTEYLIRVFDPPAKIRGLAWVSATGHAGSCLALDVQQDKCVSNGSGNGGELELELVSDSKVTYSRRAGGFDKITMPATGSATGG